MKCRVVSGFEDIKTGVFHNVGDVLTDDPREEDFIAASVVVPDESTEPQKDETSFAELSVREIKEKLDAAGVSYSDRAKKDELLALLEAAE